MEKKYQEWILFAYELKYNLFNDYLNEKYKVKKLDSVLNYTSSNLSLNKLKNNEGNFPLYGADGFVKNINFYDMNEDYISIVKDGNGVGRLSYNKSYSSIVGTMGYLTVKNEDNLRYVYYAMTLLNLNKYIIGSTIPHIYFKDFSKEKIILPHIKDQNKVAEILLNIEYKTNIILEEIRLTKEFKRTLLSKMFC